MVYQAEHSKESVLDKRMKEEMLLRILIRSERMNKRMMTKMRTTILPKKKKEQKKQNVEWRISGALTGRWEPPAWNEQIG